MIISSLLLLYSYVLWVTLAHNTGNLPISLSDTYYILERKKFGWIFQLLLLIVSSLILVDWINSTPNSYQFLPFLSISSVLFVAVSPRFLEKFEGKVHYCSAGIAVAAAFVWCLLNEHVIWCLPELIFFGVLTSIYPRKWALFLELMMFTAVSTLLLI